MFGVALQVYISAFTRYRALMIPLILEKAAVAIPTVVLFLGGRLHVTLLAGGLVGLAARDTLRRGVRANAVASA